MISIFSLTWDTENKWDLEFQDPKPNFVMAKYWFTFCYLENNFISNIIILQTNLFVNIENIHYSYFLKVELKCIICFLDSGTLTFHCCDRERHLPFYSSFKKKWFIYSQLLSPLQSIAHSRSYPIPIVLHIFIFVSNIRTAHHDFCIKMCLKTKNLLKPVILYLSIKIVNKFQKI